LASPSPDQPSEPKVAEPKSNEKTSSDLTLPADVAATPEQVLDAPASQPTIGSALARADASRLVPAQPHPDDLTPLAANASPAVPKVQNDPFAQTASAKPALRYNGKTFDEWQEIWKTELSTDKRVEAVKALAAFGANGYGKEASRAILDIAGQYDWTRLGGIAATEQLQWACLESFADDGQGKEVPQNIPPKVAIPVLSQAVKSGDRQQKLFLDYVLPRMSGDEAVSLLLILTKDEDSLVRQYALSGLPNLAIHPHNEKVAARVREALDSKDPDDVSDALTTLLSSDDHFAALPPNFTPTLFSADERVRKIARRVARDESRNDETANRIVNEVLAVLKDDSQKQKHTEAIRALAAVGKAAKPATPMLRSALQSDDQSTVAAAAMALRRILDHADYNRVLVGTLGDRFGITVGPNGDSLFPPADREKVNAWIDFEHKVAEEEKQLLN
jgi:hypothetical protein